LGQAPVLPKNDLAEFSKFKRNFNSWAKSCGASKFLNTEAKEGLREAIIYLAPYGFNEQQAAVKFKEAHERIWGKICMCTQDAMGTALVTSIEAEQLEPSNQGLFLVNNCNYLWTRICSTFEQTSGNNILDTFTQFLNIRYDKTENPRTFKQKFTEIIHKINNMEHDVIKPGERISEGFKLAVLVRSLPPNLNTLVQVTMATNQNTTIHTLFDAMQRSFDALPANKSYVPGGAAFTITTGKKITECDDGDTPDSDKDYQALAFQQTKHQKRNRRHNRVRNQTPGTPTINPNYQVTLTFLEGAEVNESNDEALPNDMALVSQTRKNATLTEVKSDRNDEEQDNENETITDLYRPTSLRASELILDTGASKHVVFDRDLLEDVRSIDPFSLHGATGHHTIVKEAGKLRVNKNILIGNVYYVPRATHNLISLAVLLEGGMIITKINKHEIHITRYPRGQNDIGIPIITLKFIRLPGSSVWRFKLPNYVHNKKMHAHDEWDHDPIDQTGSRLHPPDPIRRKIPKKDQTQAAAAAKQATIKAKGSKHSDKEVEKAAANFLAVTTEELSQFVCPTME
jgi:hypothetical protein